ncbi:D-alanyl-D-alanine carboxypeptidase/D-alanyl-D-alanine endopeptidase [Glycomyces xiaoerkulensis]|uniref:D-alanyl-D-alanine carboxypeptidase/D-alanyl-D-alanine endopeptidase n=1 Tax=Glycomyces xiaoerkulensis TaxID=2038139 RepID=UPI000C25699B|nr:D-alanyl-D-alanine carboxypeptidase/D-alanyl-D-alanine-endopeptidase [Glycomyces xiaoerkulensis]
MPLTSPSPPRSALAVRLEAVLGDRRLPGRTGAVVTDLATGAALYERRPREPIEPASAVKLVTAIAAADRLGPDHRVPTSVVDAGSDAVALVGGGDVTLSRKGTGHYPGAASVAELARAALAARGGRPPRTLIVDPVAGPGPRAPGTGPDDLRHATAAMAPLMLDGGRLRSGHDRRRRAPGVTATRRLARLLGVRRIVKGRLPHRAPVLATVWSPLLSDLVGRFLGESDNTLADMVALRLAHAVTGELTWSAVGRTLTTAWSDLGADTAEVSIVDGSGLSRANRCTAAALTGLLTAAWTRPHLRPVLDHLPVAGRTGTLRDRFQHAPAAVGAVRAKTGTLNGVSSLTGLAFGPRPVAFAFLTSGNPDHGAARAALDEAAAAAVTEQD